MTSMAAPEKDDYAAFERKVKRTVYIDNLSPHVTEAVLKTALDQFGSVKSVQFIPNYLIPGNIPQCALVEMENQKEASSVVKTMTEFPFMICGMPRPVRALPAEMDMFADKPRKPGRRIQCRWVDSTDPDFGTARKLKHLAQTHSAQAAFLLKQQQIEEENLAKKQQDLLKGNYKKYEMMEGVTKDGSARRLAEYYKMKLGE